MLTVEMLKQNQTLSGLTDTVLNAIAEMSKNDENTVIGARIGALHGQYDADILGVTGIKKNDGEKSYDYAKRILTEYKAKADSVNSVKADLEAAKAKVVELQAVIDKGAADETLKQQLKDSKAQVTQLKAQLQAKEAEYTEKVGALTQSIKDTQVDYEFKAATSGLKFKAGITEAIQQTLLNAAKAEVLAKGTPDFIDNGKGGKDLVMRGQDGNILNNPKNNLNPYTIKELVMETSLKDVLDTGRQQQGGGSGPAATGAGGANFIDLSGVKSQVEADKVIEAHLLANGLTRDSQAFAEQSMQIRADNNVTSLPIR